MCRNSAEVKIINSIAKEFLEYRLGIKATHYNVRRFTDWIIQFQRETAYQNYNYQEDR